MSDEHFTVDGTLIQAWASHKSFRKKDGPNDDGTNFHGDKRSNDTQESTPDPDAQLYKKAMARSRTGLSGPCVGGEPQPGSPAHLCAGVERADCRRDGDPGPADAEADAR